MIEGGGDLGVAGGVGRLAEIGDSHASGKGARKLDVDGGPAGLDDVWINEIGDGARVVDRWVIKALVGLVGLAEEAEKANDELRDWGFQSLDFGFDLRGGQCLVREVESHHGDGPGLFKDDVGGLGIDLDIELGDGGPIAFVVAAAHEDYFLDALNDAWLFARGHRNIGKRAGGYQGDGAGLVRHDGVDDEVDGVGVGKRGAWVRKLDAFHVHAGGAVDSLGNFDGAHERAIAAGINRNLWVNSDFLDYQGVVGDFVQGLIAPPRW